MANFMVVSHARSGSNLMVRTLNSHPKIACFGEILKPGADLKNLQRLNFSEEDFELLKRSAINDTSGFAETIYRQANTVGYAAAGMKLFYYHARKPRQDESIWTSIEHGSGIKVLHLYREDSFASYLSRELAAATARWHHASVLEGDPDYQTQIRVDIADFIRYRENLIDTRASVVKSLPQERTLTVTYEQFTTEFNETLCRLWQFLGVPKHNTHPLLAKQARRPWQEYVRNSAEVERVLSRL